MSCIFSATGSICFLDMKNESNTYQLSCVCVCVYHWPQCIDTGTSHHKRSTAQKKRSIAECEERKQCPPPPSGVETDTWHLPQVIISYSKDYQLRCHLRTISVQRLRGPHARRLIPLEVRLASMTSLWFVKVLVELKGLLGGKGFRCKPPSSAASWMLSGRLLCVNE